MKAVILAGGRGERLRPITDTRPKPLVPVLARPVMDYCLSLMSHHGIREAIVTTHYLSEQIRERYGEHAFGISLSYSQEESPMGTAGGVKKLEAALSGEESFLVMSGDALCDFDLSRAIRFHKEKQADVTIILSSVKTPLEYGVVLQDTFEKIFAFSEKPDWSETFSDLVNTGVYILSTRVLQKIPQGKVFDFSHDLFPLLLREGYRLFGYKDRGYWCDIGKIPTLYRCNQDLLRGKAQTYLPLSGKTVVSPDGKGLYFVSDAAHVEEGASIQTGSVISPGAHLKEGSRVAGSIVMENVKLEKGSFAQNAVLCEETVLGEEAMALSGSVLGAGSVVRRGGSTQYKKKYPPYSVLSKSDPFQEDGVIFTEEGIGAGDHIGLTREQAETLGFAFARSFQQKIGILWDETEPRSSYFATAFAGGVLRGGEDAHLLGTGFREVASFAAGMHKMPTLFCSVHEEKGLFFAFQQDGLPLLRREVLRLLRFCEETKFQGRSGSLFHSEQTKQAYADALAEEMGKGDGKAVRFSGNLSAVLKTAAIKAGFRAYDTVREEGLGMEVFHRGLKLFWNSKKLADTEKARLFLIEKELRNGRRHFCLPVDAPRFFSEHIRSRGGNVEYFSLRHTVRKEEKERKEAALERWLFDHTFLAARLLKVLSSMEEEAIEQEFRACPDIYITQLRYFPKEENKARLMHLVSRLPAEQEGVRIQSGFFGMKIISEALSFEAALDHAFEYRGKLNEIEQTLGGR